MYGFRFRGWNTSSAQFMLEKGADVNKADKYGRSPLHLATAVNHHQMIEWLIEHGVRIVYFSISTIKNIFEEYYFSLISNNKHVTLFLVNNYELNLFWKIQIKIFFPLYSYSRN